MINGGAEKEENNQIKFARSKWGGDTTAWGDVGLQQEHTNTIERQSVQDGNKNLS